MKSFPLMLSMDFHVKTVNIYRWLSMRGNSFGEDSVFPRMLSVDTIVSTYAQHTHAIIFENYSKIPN